MSVLLDLPGELRSSIVGEWIEVRDLLRLDVALVKRDVRGELLLQIAQDGILLSGTIPKLAETGQVLRFLHWLGDHGFAIKSLQFSKPFSGAEMVYCLDNSKLCDRLEAIEFTGLGDSDMSVFRRFVTSCHRLRKIVCAGLTDEHFQQLANDNSTINETTQILEENSYQDTKPLLPSLREAILNNCTNVGDSTLAILSIHAPNLTRVHCRSVKRITDDGVRSLSQLPKLRDVDFTMCSRITDTGLENFLSNHKESVLQSVNLYYCRAIGDRGIGAITLRHPGLHTLNVAGCNNLSDFGLVKIAHHCGLNLVDLNLANCGRVSAQSLEILAMTCTNLRVLILANVKSTTDAVVELLWRNCLVLERLSLKECDQLTDGAFMGKPFMWIHMKHLDLSYCTNVGDVGLLQIATFCPSLQVLRMTGCNRLTLPCLRRATITNEFLHINIEQE